MIVRYGMGSGLSPTRPSTAERLKHQIKIMFRVPSAEMNKACGWVMGGGCSRQSGFITWKLLVGFDDG